MQLGSSQFPFAKDKTRVRRYTVLMFGSGKSNRNILIFVSRTRGFGWIRRTMVNLRLMTAFTTFLNFNMAIGPLNANATFVNTLTNSWHKDNDSSLIVAALCTPHLRCNRRTLSSKLDMNRSALATALSPSVTRTR